jgi:hypothetical protein
VRFLPVFSAAASQRAGLPRPLQVSPVFGFLYIAATFRVGRRAFLRAVDLRFLPPVNAARISSSDILFALTKFTIRRNAGVFFRLRRLACDSRASIRFWIVCSVDFGIGQVPLNMPKELSPLDYENPRSKLAVWIRVEMLQRIVGCITTQIK